MKRLSNISKVAPTPKGADRDAAVARWKATASDPDAHYDDVVTFDAADIAPTVTWGIDPGQAVFIHEAVPHRTKFKKRIAQPPKRLCPTCC
jgi:homoaconitase/3-isopropylmalate dehydratase large subunit